MSNDPLTSNPCIIHRRNAKWAAMFGYMGLKACIPDGASVVEAREDGSSEWQSRSGLAAGKQFKGAQAAE